MPIVWRLATPAYAQILDGEGNRVTGARWNSPGRGVVYASANLSLCVLETFIHIPAALRLTLPDFEAVRISVPDDAGATQVSIADLNQLLSSPDPEASFRAIGDRWLSAANDLILAAPSVVVAEEWNFMINPAHPRMKDVEIVNSRRFRFDARLKSA